MVGRAEHAGEFPRIVDLVCLGAAFKAHREGLDTTGGVLTHDGEKDAGINSRTQEKTKWNIAPQLQTNSVLEQRLVFLDQLILIPSGSQLRPPCPETLAMN